MRKSARWKQRVPLHDCNGNFLCEVAQAQGERMVEEGLAIAVRDFRYGRTCVLRYQETVGATASASEESKTTITLGEMQANLSVSRTLRLPEWDTLGRDSKRQREMDNDPRKPIEDYVERAQNKIRFWPDARNPRGVPVWNPRHIEWSATARSAGPAA